MMKRFITRAMNSGFAGPVVVSYGVVGVTFVGSVVLARATGPDFFGQIMIIISWVLLASALGSLGMPILAMRRLTAADYTESGDAPIRILALIIMLIGTTSVSLGLVMFFGLTDTNYINLPLWAFGSSLVMLAAAQSAIQLGVMLLRVQEYNMMAIALERLWRPMGFLVAVGYMQISEVFGILQVLGCLLGSALITLICQYGLISMQFSRYSHNVSIRSIISTIKDGIPMWLGSLMPNLAKRVDIIVLSITAGPVTAALYIMAQRFAELPVVGGAAVSVILGPALSRQSSREGEHVGDTSYASVRSTLTSGLYASLFFGLPGVLLLGALAEPLLSIAGPEFKDAKNALIWLLLGSLSVIISRPFTVYLMMSGHAAIVAKVIGYLLPIHILLMTYASLNFGLTGVALIRTLTTVILQLALMAIAIHKVRQGEMKNAS